MGKRRRNSSVVVSRTKAAKKVKISSTPNASIKEGAFGSYSNSAIAMMSPGQPVPTSKQEQALAIKIARAMLSGPRHITKDATVAEMGEDGRLIILRQGTNNWICFPGDENQIGNPPMCADPMGLQWMMDWSALDDHLAFRRQEVRTAQYSQRCRCLGDVRWHTLRLSAHLRHTLGRQCVQ
jgi:hypothetical protein